MSMLAQLFTMFCFKCKGNKPSISVNRNGTKVTVWQHCQKCGEKAFKWESQPMVLGKYPAGNVILCFAILMAGASVSKVLLVFKHMGLCGYNVRTYFIHQHKFLLPVILKYWEEYQAVLVEKVKTMKDTICSLAFCTRKRSLELRQFFSRPCVNFGSLVANAITEIFLNFIELILVRVFLDGYLRVIGRKRVSRGSK